MEGKPISLRVVLFVEQSQWIARCIEFDVAGQGSSLDEALESLEVCFVAHVLMNVRDNRSPTDGLPPAPDHVVRRFEESIRIPTKKLFRMPAEASELPDGFRDAIPEPWQLPRPEANDLRIDGNSA